MINIFYAHRTLYNSVRQVEIEANYFAVCLLMPIEKVQQFIRFELEDRAANRWSGLDIAKIQTEENIYFV